MLPLLAVMAVSPLELSSVERFVRMALDCVHKEYPNKIAHEMKSDADALPPRKLTPAFYGCYDWHSSVHGHWLLARTARLFPDSGVAAEARRALERSITAESIAQEVTYLKARKSFERPYGMAWLLQLGTELREMKSPLEPALEPLELAVVEKLKTWLLKLSYPVRTGEHSQTAFAFGLMLDWAQGRGEADFARLLQRKAREFYLEDKACPIAYEPGGQDFLSPCLAEADLMRRVLNAPEFREWLQRFLPVLDVVPATVTDRSDPQLTHLDGLNLSRAWMLEGIASALPAGDARRQNIETVAQRHRRSALRAVTGEHYEGAHWLGSFAMYLVSKRGLPAHKAP